MLHQILILDYFCFFAYTTLMKNHFYDNRPLHRELSMPKSKDNIAVDSGKNSFN